MKIRLLLYGMLLASISFLHADERILSFFSDITVHADASLSVTETIKVRAEGDQIKRGIVREFPTKFKDKWGNHFQVNFSIAAVLRDGRSESYHLKDAINGVRLFIGSANVILAPGNYTYTISYRTNRCIGFFEGRDELYWNVNGTGSRFPLDTVAARVHLPEGIMPESIAFEAYTGALGEQGNNYRAELQKNNVLFTSTHAFRARECLTIVVTWPAGFIYRPSWFMQWYYWIKDNLTLFWLWLGILLMTIFYMLMYQRIRASQQRAPIIPLFYPPEGYTPGAVRYVDQRSYDATVLAADIIHMAVHGLLTIEYKKMFLGHEYILEKTKEPAASAWQSHYDGIFKQLFQTSARVSLKSEKMILHAANLATEKQYKKLYDRFFLSDAASAIGWALLGSLIFIVPALFSLTPFAILGIGVLILCFIFFTWASNGYTQEGKRLKEQVEGFRMYLKTAEEERLAIIGTPPTKTPELYEEYLPYAVALGCEKAWTAQFAPMFQAMAQQGIIYTPRWYYGGHGFLFSPAHFAPAFVKDVGYTYSTPISSSSNIPGSSSGSGGRGSSGGGSGGGGVGGW